MAIALEDRNKVVAQHRTHAKDTGSPQVQIAMLTARIKSVSEHLGGHLKDNHSRRGLVNMVGRRNRLLKYLASNDPKEYQALIGKLGLRK